MEEVSWFLIVVRQLFSSYVMGVSSVQPVALKREEEFINDSYFAPEYFMHGIVDEKTDVFSFGVLLLELITGREALNDSKQSLVLWAKPLLENSIVKQLVDPSLRDNYDPAEMDRVILVASLCTEQAPILRPRMSQASNILQGCVFLHFDFTLQSGLNSLGYFY
ncbi:Receptor-like cytosolic serine/threonine-protein kinase rbk2 [Sarracenia purpurea var. burkii]